MRFWFQLIGPAERHPDTERLPMSTPKPTSQVTLADTPFAWVAPTVRTAVDTVRRAVAPVVGPAATRVLDLAARYRYVLAAGLAVNFTLALLVAAGLAGDTYSQSFTGVEDAVGRVVMLVAALVGVGMLPYVVLDLGERRRRNALATR